LINDEERLNQRERQEKLERLWAERIRNVGDEIAEYELDIESWFTRTENMLEALEGNVDRFSFSEEISGQYNILNRRLLPKTKAWIVTLTKAGNSTNHDLMRRAIDIKNRLAASLVKFEALDLTFDTSTDLDIKAEDIKTEKSSDVVQDPTTWEATVKKVTGQDLKLNLQLEDKIVKSEVGDGEDMSEGYPRTRQNDR
jgi:hypothetical protein